jgi:rare lipoprotein A (peptidoglycan hydrolase)
MNHRIKAGVLAGLGVSLVAGCAYLPQGYPSRTGHGKVERAAKADTTEALFVDTGESATATNPALDSLDSAPIRGLRVRKSKRGNMDSYVVRGQRYFTMDSSDGYSARGLASWYGPNFHGRVASNGEVYDMYRLTAAHKTLPLPTFARVTHIDNGKSVIVKINDRGPFSGDRLIDLSFAAALELGMVNDGTAMVEIKALSPQELMVLSGPKNKLGVEFYYDYNEQPRNGTKVAVDSLFVNDRETTDSTVAQATLPATDIPPLTPAPDESLTAVGLQQQGENVVVAADPATVLPVAPAVNPLVVADSTVTAGAAPVAEAEGTAVDISGVEAEYLEVVVPGRKRPANAEPGIFAGIDIPLKEVAEEEGLIADADQPAELPAVATADTQRVAVPLVDVAALPAVPADGTPALMKADLPALSQPAQEGEVKLRYYLQAGVFANVNDAERVATNIVLEIPREEVHVKPLKNSAMYRVTVGPIVSQEHAKAVAGKLNVAGIENYTVKVKES